MREVHKGLAAMHLGTNRSEPAESLQIHCRHMVSRTVYFQTYAPARPRPRSGPTQIRTVRLSSSLRPWDHVWGALRRSRERQNRGNWVKNRYERLRNALQTHEKRLRCATPHPDMIGPTTWVQSATVGSSTTSAVLFPRLWGRAGQGALGAFLALSAPSTPLNESVTRRAIRPLLSRIHQ